MRKKDKLEIWLERYVHAKNLTVKHSANSNYYRFNGRIVRISDHCATSSDGDVSIILDSHDNDHYILHSVKTGEISVLTYKEIKIFIKAISLLPAIVNTANETVETILDATTENKDVLEKQTKNGKTVLGVPLGLFKPGQQQIITGTVKARLKELSNKQ